MPFDSCSLYPEPNQPGLNNNYVVNRTNTDNTHSFDLRMDHNLSENDRFFARYSFSDNHKIKPPPFEGDGDGGGFAEGDETVRVHGFAASHTHMFSPTIINEARVGISREHTNRMPTYGTDTNDLPGRYGIKGIPQLVGNGGLPTLQMSRALGSGTCRLGCERALQQYAAVQRQPHEGVQVAHLQDRLHVPGHFLRVDAAAVRARPVQLGRPLHLDGESDRQHDVARACGASSDSVDRARRRRRPGRVAGDSRLAIRRGRRLQDLPWRVCAGQLAGDG